MHISTLNFTCTKYKQVTILAHTFRAGGRERGPQCVRTEQAARATGSEGGRGEEVTSSHSQHRTWEGGGGRGEYRSETFHYVQYLEALLPFTYTILLIQDKKLVQHL